MSWVMSYDEWKETLDEHMKNGEPVEKLLEWTWNSALESGYWAIHDARPTASSPTTSRGVLPDNDDTRTSFDTAEEAVKSLQTYKDE